MNPLFFIIPAVYMTFVVIIYKHLSDWDDNVERVGVSISLPLVVGIVILALFAAGQAFYKEHGLQGFLNIGYIIVGLATPVVIGLLINGLVKMSKNLIQSIKIAHMPKLELPRQGDYIDVSYSQPVQRTVAELIDS
jgi:hypothetical protein